MKFFAFLLLWTYCVCLFGSAATAAETKIYKTVDEDGNVVFPPLKKRRAGSRPSPGRSPPPWSR